MSLAKEQFEQIKISAEAVIDFRLPDPEKLETQTFLQKEAEVEASQTGNLLLGEGNLTNGMRSSCIEPTKNDLEKFRKAVRLFENTLIPVRDEIEKLEKLEAVINEKEGVSGKKETEIRDRYAASTNFKNVESEYNRYERQYELKRAENNERPVNDFPTWGYILILAAIGSVEWLINYSVFLDAYGTPALAGGFTIVIAGLVAVVSHIHGKFCKQRNYYFGKTKTFRAKLEYAVLLVVAFLGFLGVLYWVGSARYSWAQDLIAKLREGADFSTDNSAMPNVTQKVVTSLIGNIAIWLIGVFLSIWDHDEDPEYTEASRHYKKWKREFTKLCQTRDDEIMAERGALEREKEKEKNMAETYAREYRAVLDLKNRVKSKQEGLLEEALENADKMTRVYRQMLVSIARANGAQVKFNKDGTLIDLDAYRQIDISCPPATFSNNLRESA